jgi:hypothetical protein
MIPAGGAKLIEDAALVWTTGALIAPVNAGQSSLSDLVLNEKRSDKSKTA